MTVDEKQAFQIRAWLSGLLARGLLARKMVDAGPVGDFPLLNRTGTASFGLAVDESEIPALPVLAMPERLSWLAETPWRRALLTREGLFLEGRLSNGEPVGFGFDIPEEIGELIAESPRVMRLAVMRSKSTPKAGRVWSWRTVRTTPLISARSKTLLQEMEVLTRKIA